jgi:hypothetical protein
MGGDLNRLTQGALAESDAAVILGASVIGDAHVRSGLPCQDAFHTLVRDGIVVVAVADGLGSATHSDLGATFASEVAATVALEAANGDPSRAALEGVVAAREALEALAKSDDIELTDLACTLIVAVKTDRVGIAHIGDGAAVGLRGDEAFVLSPPAASEYLNETDPLTAKNWIDNVRPVVCVDGIDALGMFTDGCHHAAVRQSNGHLTAHDGFFGPLFRFARSGVAIDEGERALAELLKGPKMSEHSDDDKTLVLAVLR